MKINNLISMAVRNLFRQKSRTILLSIVIAFGMSILVLTSAFTNGLVDIILNKLIVNMFGHINISAIEKTKNTKYVIRDIDRITNIASKLLPNIEYFRESIETPTRAIGNKRNEFIFLSGIQPEFLFAENSDEQFLSVMGQIIAGNPADLTNGKYENPVAIRAKMAERLNVTLYDQIKTRMQTIYGQVQTANFTVVLILESESAFQDMSVYVLNNDLKAILGYKPEETEKLVIVLKNVWNPKIVINQANMLREALKPNIAGMVGTAQVGGRTTSATMLGVMTNFKLVDSLIEQLEITDGDFKKALEQEQAIISLQLAKQLKLKLGDKFEFSYTPKYESNSVSNSYTVGAVFNGDNLLDGEVILLPHPVFYVSYYYHLPPNVTGVSNATLPTISNRLSTSLNQAFAKEFELLPASRTTEEFRDKMVKVRNTKFSGMKLDVISMYETAQIFLQIMDGLNLVSLGAVLILFFIILIGMVNTLRMTIRERTREIGTMRAIGMQRGQVWGLFVLEALMLTLFASLLGVVLGFVWIGLLSLPSFPNAGDMSFLLVNKRLHFVPTIGKIIGNIVLILIISFLTVSLPARRAAKLSAAEALQHFE